MCRALSFNLSPRYFWLDEQSRSIGIDVRHLPPELQSAVASRRFIAAVREGERILLPGQQGEAGSYRFEQHCGLFEPGQIEIAGEVFDKLSNGHIVPTPERHAVQLHAEPGCGKGQNQQLFVPQLLAGTRGERVLTGETDRLPFDRRLRRGLHGDEQPLVGFRNAGDDDAVGCSPLRLGLLHLVR